MEARSQLRHRPTGRLVFFEYSTALQPEQRAGDSHDSDRGRLEASGRKGQRGTHHLARSCYHCSQEGYVRSSTKRRTRLFPLMLLTVAVGLVQAQAKPNFSGTWKMNASKSDFGPIPAPDSQTQKINHEDPSLKLNIAESGQMGDMNFDLSYTTDGKECTNTIAGNEFKSVLKWEGDDLVIDTKGSFNGTDFTAQDRWALSGDGKTLTVQRHLSSAMGEADQKVLFEKQ